MEANCQRCNEPLRDEDRYCSACGLPQLTYSADDVSISAVNGSGANAAGMSSGYSGMPAGIAWRPALQCAALLSVPAAILCSGITPIGPSLGLLWMVGASVWAVGLYARRARPGWLSLGSGARIGLVTGLFASWLTLSVNGIALWFARFVMHQGQQMDSLWNSEVENSLQLSQQMVGQMGLTTAQAAQSTQFSRAWMLSAEGRAGIALTTFVAGAVFLVFFAMIGGALGARFLAQSRRPNA